MLRRLLSAIFLQLGTFCEWAGVRLPYLTRSIHLGKISGVPIYLHSSQVLYMVIIFFSEWLGSGLRDATFTFVVISLLFGCITAHEFGHILAARHYGIDCRDVTLSILGGVARLESMPVNPWRELVITIAGPAVNATIACLLLPWMLLHPCSLDDPAFYAQVIAGLFILNCCMLVFNLIPALPMDGGRILRVTLALKFNHYRATIWAGTLGQALAITAIPVAFWSGSYVLIILGGFIFFAATNEKKHASTTEVVRLRKLSISRILNQSGDAWMVRRLAEIDIDTVWLRGVFRCISEAEKAELLHSFGRVLQTHASSEPGYITQLDVHPGGGRGAAPAGHHPSRRG